MLLSAVSVLVVAQPSSEVPEGLTNYPVPSGNNSKFSQISVKQSHQYVCLIEGKKWLISMIFPRRVTRF